MPRISHILICLACAFPLLLAAPGWGKAFSKTVKADLNGDGKIDVVTLSGDVDDKNSGCSFRLKVNDASLTGEFDTADTPALSIVDIDITDKSQEIVIDVRGPSDWQEYRIYWYDGKAINLINDQLIGVTFSGHGFLYAGDWMGFWTRTEKYTLNRQTHKLELVPQPFYYVGVTAPVVSSMPIYANRGSSAVVANLREKSKVIILLWDPGLPAGKGTNSGDDWYLIKSESGLVGWACITTMRTSLGIQEAG